MTTFTPFRGGHLRFLKPQAAQRPEHHTLLSSGAAERLESPLAMTAWRDLLPVAAGGLIQLWPHRAVAWAILSQDAGPSMVTLVRKALRVVELSPYQRVEFTVAEGFVQGHRLAQLLGALSETPEAMRHFGFNGGSESMYSLCKGDQP